MYLIDTNILVWIIRGDKWYVRWFAELKEDGSVTLSISTITIAEIYKNVFPIEIVRTERIIEDFIHLDVTPRIAKEAGFYWKDYSKKIEKMNILDCIIAATAKEHKASLITLNIRHFPMSDIKIFNPVKMNK